MPPFVSEYIGTLFKVLQTHPGPDPASNGEGLPPSLLHVCGLQLLFGWRPLHRGRHLSDPLHRRLPSVRTHFHTFTQTFLHLPQHPLFFLPGRKYAPRCSVCGEPIMPEQGQEETVRIVALDRSFHVNCYVCEVRMKPEPVLYHKLSTVLHWTDWSVCPPGMRAPAVLRGGGPRLLPTGRPHPVQELQRSAHPGPVGQNLHWLLTWKHLCKTSRFVALRVVAAFALLIVRGWIVCYGSGPGEPATLFHFIQKLKRFLFLTPFHPHPSHFWPDLQAAWAPCSIQPSINSINEKVLFAGKWIV